MVLHRMTGDDPTPYEGHIPAPGSRRSRRTHTSASRLCMPSGKKRCAAYPQVLLLREDVSELHSWERKASMQCNVLHGRAQTACAIPERRAGYESFAQRAADGHAVVFAGVAGVCGAGDACSGLQCC